MFRPFACFAFADCPGDGAGRSGTMRDLAAEINQRAGNPSGL
jgi:hypothetical protein